MCGFLGSTIASLSLKCDITANLLSGWTDQAYWWRRSGCTVGANLGRCITAGPDVIRKVAVSSHFLFSHSELRLLFPTLIEQRYRVRTGRAHSAGNPFPGRTLCLRTAGRSHDRRAVALDQGA